MSIDEFDKENNIVDLDDDKKAEILRDIVTAFAKKCLRTILVAYTDLSK